MVYGRSSSHSLVIESGGLYYIHNLAAANISFRNATQTFFSINDSAVSDSTSV